MFKRYSKALMNGLFNVFLVKQIRKAFNIYCVAKREGKDFVFDLNDLLVFEVKKVFSLAFFYLAAVTIHRKQGMLVLVFDRPTEAI